MVERAVTVTEQFEQFAQRLIGHRRHCQIIEHQDVGFCPLRRQPGIAPWRSG